MGCTFCDSHIRQFFGICYTNSLLAKALDMQYRYYGSTINQQSDKLEFVECNYMVYKMNLWHNSYMKIKEHLKSIEMRLNDDKRSKLKIGDTIEFTDTSNNEIMYCSVTNLYRYSDFEELYRNHDKTAIGYDENDYADPSDMLKYYTVENIEKYGVLGIEITVI